MAYDDNYFKNREDEFSNVREDFFNRLLKQESAGNPNAESPVGAYGLGQVMPATYEEIRQDLNLPPEMDWNYYKKTPALQRLASKSYLSKQLKNFDGSESVAAAAYNAGPSRAKEWVGKFGMPTEDVSAWANQIPYGETKDYVNKVAAGLLPQPEQQATSNRFQNARDYNNKLNSYNTALRDTTAWKETNPEVPETMVDAESLQLNRKLEEQQKKQRMLDEWRALTRKNGGDLGINELAHYRQASSDVNAAMVDINKNPDKYTGEGQVRLQRKELADQIAKMKARGDYQGAGGTIDNFQKQLDKLDQEVYNGKGVALPTYEQKQFLGLDKLEKNYNSVTDSYEDSKGRMNNKIIPQDSYFNSVEDKVKQMSDTPASPAMDIKSSGEDLESMLSGGDNTKAQEVDKLQQLMDIYRQMQGQQIDQTGNARMIQAANKVAQGFALGSGAKIDDGSEIPEGLIKDAEIPAQNMYRQQTMEQAALKNKDLQEGLDPNSAVSKAQSSLVKNLASQLGLSPEDMLALSGPMSADNSGKLMSTLMAISNARQASQAKKDALALKAEEKAKLSEKTTGEIANYDSGINIMQNLLAEKIGKGWDTGKLSFGQNAVTGWFGMDDAEKTSFKRAVNQQLADYVRSISGTAASDAERRALASSMPSVYDNDATFEMNAKQFINKLKDIKRIELGVLERSGKNVSALKPDMEMSPATQKVLGPKLIPMKYQGRIAYFDQNKNFVKWKDQ